jgi:hypothetical protein
MSLFRALPDFLKVPPNQQKIKAKKRYSATVVKDSRVSSTVLQRAQKLLHAHSDLLVEGGRCSCAFIVKRDPYHLRRSNSGERLNNDQLICPMASIR